ARRSRSARTVCESHRQDQSADLAQRTSRGHRRSRERRGPHLEGKEMATGLSARRKDREHLLEGLLAGLVGGLIGSWMMNQFQAVVARATERSHDGEPSDRDDEDATQRLAQAIAATTIDRRLSKQELNVAGPVVHYAYGTLMGGVYGA